MKDTAVAFTPKCYKHNPGPDHPESADRLRAIVNALKSEESRKITNWEFVEPRKARLEDVALVHDMQYIRLVKSTCNNGGGMLDSGDTVASSETFDAALHAAGGGLTAVDLVMTGKCRNSFALVRPPGHHAGRFSARGFCIFNNATIAAKHLLKEFSLKRVLIIDVDAHHGNGTQEIFYDTDKVLYISLHEDPRIFPGTGFTSEVGEHEGLGYTVNVPFPYGTSDRIYVKALDEVVTPIVSQYEPQFILVSAGFDAHHRDPVGNLSLSAKCFQNIYDTIVKMALRSCNGRLTALLEGGYNLTVVGKLAASAIAKMTPSPYHVRDANLPCRRPIEAEGEKVIQEVKKAQKSFWKIG